MNSWQEAGVSAFVYVPAPKKKNQKSKAELATMLIYLFNDWQRWWLTAIHR